MHCPAPIRALRSFPTRRSSDLKESIGGCQSSASRPAHVGRDTAQGEHSDRKAKTAVDQFLRTMVEKVYDVFSRSEEHTSELQSHHDLVCRLLLEKKKNKRRTKN